MTFLEMCDRFGNIEWPATFTWNVFAVRCLLLQSHTQLSVIGGAVYRELQQLFTGTGTSYFHDSYGVVWLLKLLLHSGDEFSCVSNSKIPIPYQSYKALLPYFRMKT